MNATWNDAVYPFHRAPSWSHRLARLVLCRWLKRHVMGVPQKRRPTDLTLSYGPCRRCVGVHYWRNGQWQATYA